MNYDLNMGNGIGAQGMHPYSLGTSSTYPSHPAITDLSTVIFPGPEEPFGYPHQPLTTFENNQQFIKSDPYAAEEQQQQQHQHAHAFNSASPMVGHQQQHGPADDNLEAQFFALPPYLGQQQFGPGGPLRSNDMAAAAAAAMVGTPPTAQLPNGGAWPTASTTARQVLLPPHTVAGDAAGGINVQDIFGGVEWNSVLMNGFQPQ